MKENISECTEDIAEGWAETTLDRILLTLESGSRPKGGVRGINGGIPSIGGEHLNSNGGFQLQSIKYVPFNFHQNMHQGQIRVGDVLVVKDGATTGKVSLVREDFPHKTAVVNEHVFICRIHQEVLPRFVFYYMFSEIGQERILENFRGSAQGGINQSFAQGTPIPIAPLAEQKRIVAKVEELLARVNLVRDRLEKVPKIMKRFRQSVLAAACSGRLTDSDSSHWKSMSLEQLITDSQNGFSKRSGKSGELTTVLRLADITSNKIHLLSGGRKIALSDEERKKYALECGDVLVIRVNGSADLVGRFVLAHEADIGLTFCDHFIRLKVDQKLIDPKMLVIYAENQDMRDFINTNIVSSAGQNTVSQKTIKSIEVRVPSLKEQHEIVRRVDALFKLADAIEKRVEAATIRADKLTQSILAKAFRGELGTTEAELARQEGRDYEPASVLLERIKAERKIEKPKNNTVQKRKSMSK